jgi:hypothetical protein
MESSLRYSSGLEDLLYLTSEAEFRRSIDRREELVILLALKEIDCIAPVLSLREREILLLRLINNPVVSYIPAFNVSGLQLDLPFDTYRELKEISVDENNLIRILMMIKEGMIPALEKLSLTASRPIEITPTHLGNLRSLTLKNTSKELYHLPKLDGLFLDSLELSGYAMEFQGTLPSTLKLRGCYVKNSHELEGCEEMVLTNTRWDSGTSPGSLPTVKLTIENGNLSRRLPETLKFLVLVNTEYTFPFPDGLVSLHYDDRREDVEDHPEIVLETRSLETLAVTLYRSGVFIPPTVRSLFVLGVMPSELPPGLVSLELDKLTVNQEHLFAALPGTVKSLRLLECAFTSNSDIVAPETLRKIEFISCAEGHQVGINASDSMESLLVIGMYPRIRTEYLSEGSATRCLHAKTNALLMNLREFHLFCISQLGKLLFYSFEDCYTDIVMGVRWKTPEELRAYIGIMFRYPYRIPIIQTTFVAKKVVMEANPDATIRIGNTSRKVGDLRKTILSGVPVADQRISSFVDELMMSGGAE